MSSGTAGAIKGGMAYVEAYLDDNPLTKGLAKLQGKLKLWQSSLAKMGAGAYGGQLPEPFAALARFATSPAGAFSALLGAAKLTADAREEMFKMSETTGVAVDKLSALSYAARRAGVSNEALASGLRKLQGREFQAAMGGGKKAGANQRIMGGLGLDTKADAADQLRQITRQFEKLDAVSRIGLARKLGISELLPLINQGIDGLDALTAKAKALGLVMSEEDAKAGKQFELAMGDLHDVLMSSVKAIGGALVPMITGLTNLLVPVVVGVRDWIKNHKALTIALFAGTGAIVAGGIALKGLAVVTGLVSMAIGGLKMVVSGLGVAFSVLSSVVGFLPLLANPFVLIGLAIVGVIAWLASLSGALTGMGAQWSGFAADAMAAFGAIGNALARGDLAGAWNVVIAFLKTEWVRATEFMAQAWGNFRDYVKAILDQYVPWWSNVVDGIVAVWDEFIDVFKAAAGIVGKVWDAICGYLKDAFHQTVKFCSDTWNGFLDWVARTSTEDDAKLKRMQEAAAGKGIAAGNFGVADPAAIRHEDQVRAEKFLQADLAREKLARKRSGATRLEDAQVQLKAAIDAANVPGKELVGGPKGHEAFASAAAAESRGTFSGAVAAMLGGGGSLAEKQVKLQDEANSALWRQEALAAEQLAETKRLNENLKKVNMVD